MSRVSEWLETIGLAQYADAFHANDIDIDLLGQLDDQILKDIGVSSAGHRLRIRNAIAKLAKPIVPLAKDENAAGAKRNASSLRRAPPSHRDVFGPHQVLRHSRRVWTLRTCARSFPPTRSASGDRAALRWVRGEVHGRRRACVLWLSERTRTTPSERCELGWS